MKSTICINHQSNIMMKRMGIICLGVLFCCHLALGQTAPDFTAEDCRGNTHNLYAELAQGNVIILEWVMPCASCIGPSLTAYNVIESFSAPNLQYYLIDDAANTPCVSLITWATNIGIGTGRTVFSTPVIVEENYGGIGMPHVMVVGPNGTIYFNGLGAEVSNAVALQAGISNALLATGTHGPDDNALQAALVPNPADATVTLQYELEEPAAITIALLNASGQRVATYASIPQDRGPQTYPLDVRSVPSGQYFVHLSDGRHVQAVQLIVQH